MHHPPRHPALLSRLHSLQILNLICLVEHISHLTPHGLARRLDSTFQGPLNPHQDLPRTFRGPPNLQRSPHNPQDSPLYSPVTLPNTPQATHNLQ